MHVVLFEDFLTDELGPMTLTRPAFALSCAGTSLLEAMRRLAPQARLSAIVRPYLQRAMALRIAGAPADPLPEPGTGPVLLLNAQLAPSLATLRELLDRLAEGKAYWLPMEGTDGRVAAMGFPSLPFSLEGKTPTTITPQLQASLPERLRATVTTLELPHDVIRFHQTQMHANLVELSRLAPLAGEEPWKEVRDGVYTRGSVAIADFVACDAAGEHGPIMLDDGARVGPFTYLRGPVMIGRGSIVSEHASLKSNTQVGASCRAGGEIHSSILEPYSNKVHHGFLGHAWIGSWVNLGAGTSNSNLKNTYGDVSIDLGGRRVATGMQFLGCIVGDHSKTAINTSVFTGKIVGVSSYLYGFVGANVPSFCNYLRTFGQVTEFRLDAAIKTARRMFARRGLEFDKVDEELLEEVYNRTRHERTMSGEHPSI